MEERKYNRDKTLNTKNVGEVKISSRTKGTGWEEGGRIFRKENLWGRSS